jgi:hypothetical protein
MTDSDRIQELVKLTKELAEHVSRLQRRVTDLELRQVEQRRR